MADELTHAEFDVLSLLATTDLASQRAIAQTSGLSLGSVNSALRVLKERGFLNGYDPTTAGMEALEPYRVDNAIILSAGFGSRFVPFTYDTPKGLLPIKGTPMIERQIQQLHEVGITDITIVVGYLKEAFDYLIDKYGVTLIFNPEYSTKNNFASVYYALDHLRNTYLLVSDDWIEDNIFHTYEYESWLSAVYISGPTGEWGVTTGPRNRITRIDTSGQDTWALLGPAYFTQAASAVYRPLVKEAYTNPAADQWYWEHIVREHVDELPVYLNKQSADNVHEFESLEQLREYDTSYREETENKLMREIADVLHVPQSVIKDITPSKEGMTNDSFSFTVNSQRYMFRLPGEGTEVLIDRKVEKQVYDYLAPQDLTDEVIWFNPDTGHRITKFYADAHVCDPFDDDELERAMTKIHELHDLRLVIDRPFDFEAMMNHYQGLLAKEGATSTFADFDEVRKQAESLLTWRDELAIPEILCHGDFNFANILLFPDRTSRLIDWEYAGMNDPIMDISMFGIFSYFDRDRLDLSLRMWKGSEPTREETARLYLYVALAGFLWTIWAEYVQAARGEDLGEYPLKMYRYMKDFNRILHSEGYISEKEPRP